MSSSSSSSSDSEGPAVPSKLKSKKSRTELQRTDATSDSDPESSSDAEESSEDGSEQSGGGDSRESGDSDSEAGDDEPETVEDDVQALSHAEKRRQKKKEQKAIGPASEKRKVENTAELPPSKVPKRQNSVWIGNLSFKTTPDSLRQFFDGVGEITRVHMPMKLASSGPGAGWKGVAKENRGFAYVDFASPDAKVLAIALSENHLDGRRLLIKDGGDFTGRPSTSTAQEGDGEAGKANMTGLSKTAQKILRSQKQPAGPTLFLGNLGFETTEQSIRSMLDSHRAKKLDDERKKADDGESKKLDEESEPAPEKKPSPNDRWIRKIRLGTFEDSGKCKGWAFVDFHTTEHATAALTNPKNYFLDGRKLVVEYASPDAVRRGGAGPRPDKAGDKPGPRRGERVRPARKRAAEDGAEAAGGDTERPAKQRRVEQAQEQVAEAPAKYVRERERDSRSGKTRAKPGAALANAERGTASIVPSQGKKIVF